MLINFTKSSIMWFHACSPNSIILPTITVDGHSLVRVDSQKYLGLHIDSKLSWRNHVANICKKMAYYLYLIGYHCSTLPKSIIKMLVESLVLSHLNHALCVWGTSLNTDLVSRLCRLYNRAIRVTCRLKKFDHVPDCRLALGWLPLNFFIQYHALNVMYKYYADDQYVSLDPAIIFGHQHSYSTRAPPHFANVVRCQLSFTNKFFRSSATSWWNKLPNFLFDPPLLFRVFSGRLYNYFLAVT